MSADDVRLQRITSNLHRLAEAASIHANAQGTRVREAVAEAQAKAAASSPKRGAGKRGRAAVVSWDIGHNPVGRAHVLYRLLEKDWDVDLIGPQWSRYGSELWAPLQGSDLSVRRFDCDTLDDFVPKAELLASARVYDLVYVCKPRLPSLYLGTLIKESSGCPMIVDVDDYELSFFQNREPASLADLIADAPTALNQPHEELATRYAQSLVAHADAVTVSNVTLRARFGGHIVRHARDEADFAPDVDARAAGRARLGIADDEFALVFVGTPRPHKGVAEVARALHELADPRIVFHVIGTLNDAALKQRLADFPRARLVFHPDCPFEELPALLAAADLVPLIQEIDHPISQHQIPAKVSDALALGVPVLATRTPPLLDLIAQGAIEPTDHAGLADSIRVLADRAFIGGEGAAPSPQARRVFTSELGMSVNRTRLDHAIDEAISVNKPLNDTLSDMLEAVREEYSRRRRLALGKRRPALNGATASKPPLTKEPERDRAVLSLRSRLARSMTRRLARRGPTTAPYDIAFFWKQNDSGLYGRRSDMVAKYLASSGRVGRLAHFDAPVSMFTLEQNFRIDQRQSRGQQDLILQTLFDRRLGLVDHDNVIARTFVSSPHERRGHLLGEPVPTREAYTHYVREQLEAAGMAPERTWAWFCPVIFEAPDLIGQLGFAGVVSDLIDDQRAWADAPSAARRLDDSYHKTLARSDLVFANCTPLADAMRSHADLIHVVPNGAERFASLDPLVRPAALTEISGPIAGYVGNLRDRIDWLLLQDLARLMPDVSFVLAGPAGDNPNAESLARRPNVYLPGVVPYEDLPAWLAAFDVGLVPHIANRLTASMNPLKVYNYFASGLPIVSTEIDNLGTIGDALTICSSTEDFVVAIRQGIARGRDTSSPAWQSMMDEIAWDSRVGSMLDVLEQYREGSGAARFAKAG